MVEAVMKMEVQGLEVLLAWLLIVAED